MTRLLLDTNIVIPLVEGQAQSLPRDIAETLAPAANSLYVSVACLWEIAIKSRLGKLPLRAPLDRLPDAVLLTGLDIIPVQAAHAVADVDPPPPTRDPFDRMLLAQCQVEGLRLVTLDRKLATHPLAWRPN